MGSSENVWESSYQEPKKFPPWEQEKNIISSKKRARHPDISLKQYREEYLTLYLCAYTVMVMVEHRRYDGNNGENTPHIHHVSPATPLVTC